MNCSAFSGSFRCAAAATFDGSEPAERCSQTGSSTSDQTRHDILCFVPQRARQILRGNSLDRTAIPGVERNFKQRGQQQRIEELLAELPPAEP